MPDVYEIVTNKVIELLEKGVIPWRQTWRAANQIWTPPRNLISGKPYRGFNSWFLSMLQFPSPYWATYKQIGERGGKVRKGESGTLVTYYSKAKKKVQNAEGQEEEKEIFILRYYTVFNLSQTEGVKLTAKEEAFIASLQTNEIRESPTYKIDNCESIIDNYDDGPSIYEEGNKAYYSPSTDIVRMPKREQFDSIENYYSILFHELVHSTGHKNRINRLTNDKFGSEGYGKEELIAELGAAFLCADAGISPSVIEDQASYLNSWIKTLKGDKRLILQASSGAQKAVEWILGTEKEDEGETEEEEENGNSL